MIELCSLFRIKCNWKNDKETLSIKYRIQHVVFDFACNLKPPNLFRTLKITNSMNQTPFPVLFTNSGQILNWKDRLCGDHWNNQPQKQVTWTRKWMNNQTPMLIKSPPKTWELENDLGTFNSYFRKKKKVLLIKQKCKKFMLLEFY